MRRIPRGVPSLALFWVAACASITDSPREAATYFPMQADSRWTYRFEEMAERRVYPVTVRSRGLRYVPELGRVVAIFDEEYPDQVLPVAFFFSDGFLQSEIRLGYRTNRDVGVFPIGTEPMRLMPVTPEVGRRWAYSADVFAGGGRLDASFAIQWRGEVERVDSVEVPAGAFEDCVRIESVAVHHSPVPGRRASEHRYVDWYAPEIGLVRSEYMRVQDGAVLTRMELVSFRRGSGIVPRQPVEMAAFAPRD